jgi:hypothetical protein
VAPGLFAQEGRVLAHGPSRTQLVMAHSVQSTSYEAPIRPPLDPLQKARRIEGQHEFFLIGVNREFIGGRQELLEGFPWGPTG